MRRTKPLHGVDNPSRHGSSSFVNNLREFTGKGLGAGAGAQSLASKLSKIVDKRRGSMSAGIVNTMQRFRTSHYAAIFIRTATSAIFFLKTCFLRPCGVENF